MFDGELHEIPFSTSMRKDVLADDDVREASSPAPLACERGTSAVVRLVVRSEMGDKLLAIAAAENLGRFDPWDGLRYVCASSHDRHCPRNSCDSS
jgi:hypothetical protein